MWVTLVAVAAPRRIPEALERSDRPLLRLHELLLEVSKGPTRLEMVCWQLNIEDSRARAAWDVALHIKLIEATGVDQLTGQATLFTLTDRGRRALRELDPRRRRD
jgi:hypothetical protein